MSGAQNDVDVDPVVARLLEQSRRDFPGWVFDTTGAGWKASKDGVVVQGPTLIQVRATIPLRHAVDHVEPQEQVVINPEQSTPARLYGALGDGKDHFAVDDANAAEMDKILPGAKRIVRANRDCLRRMVATAADMGVRQFIDLGSGLPDQPPNLHEVAQRHAPDARFIYVDRDPVVATHGRALLTSEAVDMVQADIRDINGVFDRPALHALIDVEQPTAAILGAVLHFLDDDEMLNVLTVLRQWLAPNSLLFITHGTTDQPDHTPSQIATGTARYKEQTGQRLYLRSRQEILAPLGDCVALRPGLVFAPAWNPDYEAELIEPAPHLLAVAVKIRPDDESDRQEQLRQWFLDMPLN